eukprot:CCRYP_016073-RA/>CCRYP_016073-RA protein AED:0.47 eAED:0.54 QI:0/0/0/1/0/0/3/0/110
MGIKQDVEESLKDYFITKIDGQPSEEAISKLKLELSEGLASIPTLNVHDFLAQQCASIQTPSRERQIAEHKAEIREYEMQLGVTSWARKAIVGAVERRMDIRNKESTCRV